MFIVKKLKKKIKKKHLKNKDAIKLEFVKCVIKIIIKYKINVSNVLYKIVKNAKLMDYVKIVMKDLIFRIINALLNKKNVLKILVLISIVLQNNVKNV